MFTYPLIRVAALVLTLCLLAAPAEAGAQEAPVTGRIVGVVADQDGAPIGDVSVRVLTASGAEGGIAVTDSGGAFTVASLNPGLYRVRARRIGYREAVSPLVRVVAGQAAELRVLLAHSPTQLSTITVVVSPTAIDASTTELTHRIERRDVELLPLGRDAASLVELVPGARGGFIWGAAGAAANSYQLDGVPVNHPGVGGDFLSPSLDWIDRVEVRGLGAGAEHGGFQGAIINAVIATGDNVRRSSIGANYVAPGVTWSNVRSAEEGAEQAMRLELTANSQGPVVNDRLFYFFSVQLVDRSVRVVDLGPDSDSRFRDVEQEHGNRRMLLKLTASPGIRDRVHLLAGYTAERSEHDELDGISDPDAASRVRSPSGLYGISWTRSFRTSSLETRVAGFTASETRGGYAGANVPAVQIFRIGRQPVYQNAIFDERRDPRSTSGAVTWRGRQPAMGGENEIVAGAEYTAGHWQYSRTRNGGVTWRPYIDPATGTVNPTQAESWVEVASDWGGEINLRSDFGDVALFLQDYLTLRPGLTVAAGLRYGQWSGWLERPGGAGARFLAVRDRAVDPRAGVVWDVSGRNTLVLKSHWGRYHQAMNSFFFDRAEGADAYANQRFYFQGPDLTDSRQVFTPEQRDAMTDPVSGFPANYTELIRSEAGRVENYRQPYVDQWLLGAEKTFGPRWKAELTYVNRVNGAIAGLVDRALAENYSLLEDVRVRHRITLAPVADQHGDALVLPRVWVSNSDLRTELLFRQSARQAPVPGYTFEDIASLTFTPDLVLTTVPGARRRTDQVSFSLRTEQPRWNALWSVTATRLQGNVAGLAGFGTTQSFFSGFGASTPSFTAGPAVRPNEAINHEGRLPNSTPLESKLWVGTDLPLGLRGGAFARFSRGEYFTPVFEITPRFRFVASDGSLMLDDAFNHVMGQTLLLEQRGNRQYESQTLLDLRVERTFGTGLQQLVVGADVFNVLGSDAVVARNLTINDQVASDPTSRFAAPRLRLNPRVIRFTGRVTF